MLFRSDAGEARRQVEAMVRALLVNPSTESYRLELSGQAAGRPQAGGEARRALGEEQAV